MVRPSRVVELHDGQVLTTGESVGQVEGSPLEVVSEILNTHWLDCHVFRILQLCFECGIVFRVRPELFALF